MTASSQDTLSKQADRVDWSWLASVPAGHRHTSESKDHIPRWVDQASSVGKR